MSHRLSFLPCALKSSLILPFVAPCCALFALLNLALIFAFAFCAGIVAKISEKFVSKTSLSEKCQRVLKNSIDKFKKNFGRFNSTFALNGVYLLF